MSKKTHVMANTTDLKASVYHGQRLYRIEAGDLLLSKEFSLGGGEAVDKTKDHSLFVSYRCISRV